MLETIETYDILKWKFLDIILCINQKMMKYYTIDDLIADLMTRRKYISFETDWYRDICRLVWRIWRIGENSNFKVDINCHTNYNQCV